MYPYKPIFSCNPIKTLAHILRLMVPKLDFTVILCDLTKVLWIT